MMPRLVSSVRPDIPSGLVWHIRALNSAPGTRPLDGQPPSTKTTLAEQSMVARSRLLKQTSRVEFVLCWNANVLSDYVCTVL